MKFYTILLLIFMIITQTACFKKQKKDPYNQGELVTWKINDKLIIKGRIGQRRKHIVGEFDAEFYHPNTEQFMGQFAIDYLPKKFDPISKSEATALQQNNTGDPFEFYLMLNGSWVEPTDESINAPKALDHEDQVKIQVKRVYDLQLKHNTKEFFENELMKDVDVSSAHELYGMKCYFYLKTQDESESRKRCFANSHNPIISGYSVMTFSNEVVVDYQELAYGGIQIRYIISSKNLDKVPQIDQAIWRLISIWNTAPN